MATEILHFTLGQDFGKLLMNIAQEHLIYNLNPKKAMDALQDFPKELALDILKGDFVVHIDEEEQCYMVGMRDAGDEEYPKLDMVDWCTKQSRMIHDNGMGLKKAIDEVLYIMKYKKIYKTYDYGQILDFIAGRDEAILDDLRDTQEVSQLAGLVSVVKSYIEKSMRTQSVMDWMRKTYPKDFEGVSDFSEYYSTLEMIIKKFNDILTLDFSEIEAEQQALTNYVEAAKVIDATLSKGIFPVDIMANWSAGWLSPSGDYFALNGEIANMLHIQIADALKENGVIPEDEVNPDAWLEQQGWIKIHGNNVHFAGCLNHALGKKDVDITTIQLKKVYEYCALCHSGVIKVGWRMEQMSATRFRDMYESQPDETNKKYFEY